jgi:DNA polymerase-1
MTFEHLVYDTETDGLGRYCKRMWVLVAKDIYSGEKRWWLEGDLGWKEAFDNAKLLIGHNVCGFDELILKKLFNYKIKKTTKVRDTLVMSRILNYRRFGDDGHSLDVWGRFLGFPKQEFNDWSQYSPKMLEYCLNDVDLGEKVYLHVIQEYLALSERSPFLPTYILAEQYAARWAGTAEIYGWPFDKEKGLHVFTQLEEKLVEAYELLTARLGTKVVAVDKEFGEVLSKTPKWVKSGAYDKHTADWFGVDPWSGYEDRPINGEYCRVKIEPLNLNSPADVKIFLYRNGWQPTEWNTKITESGEKLKTSPKITEDSLEFLGSDGKVYTNFTSVRSRHAILKTWLESLDEDDRLHGECITIGTPSMRSRHKLIANVPTSETPWGKEFRELFVCLPGWKLIGCDSSGNQARGLAHFLGDPEYIHTLLTSDIHAFNATKIDQALSEMGINWNEHLLKNHPDSGPDDWKASKRAVAKRILYAFLFGASGAKLWSYIFGHVDDKQGNIFKANFISAVPGFKTLTDSLKTIYKKTRKGGDGYIPSLVGNKIYVDSMHKLLVYLLQSTEKITCAISCMLVMQRLEEAGIEYIPLIFYHDEVDFMVREEDAEEAAKIGELAFKEGPEKVGITIMDGKGKIGDNWYEVH